MGDVGVKGAGKGCIERVDGTQPYMRRADSTVGDATSR